MATTKTTEELFSGNGSQTSFPFTIEYLKTSDITVKVNGVLQTETTHYSVVGTNIVFVTAPSTGTNNIRITRVTDIDTARSIYAAGSSIRAKDLNSNQDQILFKLQEKETRTPSATVSATAPTDPTSGDTWYDTVLGRSFVYYTDVDTSQWVEANPPFDAAEAVQVASQVNFLPSGTGAVTRTVDSKLEDIVSVKDFGAVGDGTANDTTAFANAIASGAATIYVPKGTYMVSTIDLSNKNNITIVGESKTLSIIKLINGSNNMTILCTTSTNITIKGLTVDGNKDNQTSGVHGIRLGGTDGIVIEDIIIQNCKSYGIGIQAGTNKNLNFNRFIIKNIGHDGIDFKDKNDANDNIIITNGFIGNFGIDGTDKPAIDLRGPVNVSNINIELNNNSNIGIRLRQDGGNGEQASGNINNINILGIGSNTYYGIYTEPTTVQDYSFNNIFVKNANLGVIRSIGGLFNNLVAEGGDSDSFSVGGTDTIINNLKIRNAGNRGVDIEANSANVRIIGFHITNSSLTGNKATAIRIQTGATNTVISGGFITSGMSIGDSEPSTTVLRDVVNFDTTANLISGELAVDSTGAKTATLTHSFGQTPSEQDILLSLVQSTGTPTDFALDYGPMLLARASTTIGVGIKVGTASATSGAKVKITALIRRKQS